MLLCRMAFYDFSSQDIPSLSLKPLSLHILSLHLTLLENFLHSPLLGKHWGPANKLRFNLIFRVIFKTFPAMLPIHLLITINMEFASSPSVEDFCRIRATCSYVFSTHIYMWISLFGFDRWGKSSISSCWYFPVMCPSCLTEYFVYFVCFYFILLYFS